MTKLIIGKRSHCGHQQLSFYKIGPENLIYKCNLHLVRPLIQKPAHNNFPVDSNDKMKIHLMLGQFAEVS